MPVYDINFLPSLQRSDKVSKLLKKEYWWCHFFLSAEAIYCSKLWRASTLVSSSVRYIRLAKLLKLSTIWSDREFLKWIPSHFTSHFKNNIGVRENQTWLSGDIIIIIEFGEWALQRSTTTSKWTALMDDSKIVSYKGVISFLIWLIDHGQGQSWF